jgi:hypothetical protein
MYNPDVTSHLHLLDVDEEIFSTALDVVFNGVSVESDYVRVYPYFPRAGYIFLELITPDRSVMPVIKGSLRLMEQKSISEYSPPPLTAEIIEYRLMSYLDHDIRLCPRHVELAESSKMGKLNFAKIIICAVICPGRGAITFDTEK